jgi:hypothetical protein
VDNEREAIDRGYSGRFSSNMGFKMDFDDYQAEEFGYGEHDINNSLLRFKKDEAPPPVEAVSCEQKDEGESLQFVESGHASSGGQPFKLFYYKKLEK